ncbi:MAG TPA: hypothetical protein PKD61_34570, partial [Polyangiaceae bacterium]|nr:hypothetical protein [Polyangiaceae bacterium]
PGTGTDTLLRRIHFGRSDLEAIGEVSKGGGYAVEGVKALYDEVGNAFVSMYKNASQGFREFWAKGVQHYSGARMVGGSISQDPRRLFEEAASSYVAHRAATYYGAYAWLKSAMDSNRLTPNELKKISAYYDSAMKRDTFGYETRWSGLGKKQLETTQPISKEMKQFLDGAVLEGRIPDTFDKAGASMMKAARNETQSEAK